MSDDTLETTREPKLLFPQLQAFYDKVIPLSWPLIRVTAGGLLIAHGWPKLMMGVEAAGNMALARRGIYPVMPLAYALIFLETIGGLCIALGLFTRFMAAAVAIEMVVIVYHHLDAGFGWTNRGYEYPLFWGLVMLAIALRGGGPYSLDRRLGKEL